MTLTKEQAVHCADVFSNYFDKFGRIDEYMREQKLNSMAERSPSLFGMGPEEDLFSDFTMSPADMEFEIIELPQDRWDIYLNMISSHSNMTSIPGRCLRLAVFEKKSQKLPKDEKERAVSYQKSYIARVKGNEYYEQK